MNTDWLDDGRKIPDEIMSYLRKMAVHAVRVRGESPEVVARIYNFHRDCIYRWLREYDSGGFDVLESRVPPGAQPLITTEIDEWLKATILEQTPVAFGYDTNLWTCRVLVQLLQKFNLTVSESTVELHLKKLGLTCQKPEYQDIERDERDIEFFIKEKLPRIQRLVNKLDADVAFEDESGVGVRTRHGRTWGMRGQTPVVKVSMQRKGYNILSTVSPKGKMRYSVKDGAINGERYIEFLRDLIRDRTHPLVLLVDRASFHKSKPVRDFVKAHRDKIRVFFLPKRAPDMNPAEQVWNEVKNNQIGKQPVKSKSDLKERLQSALRSLQKNTQRIISFFHMPRTRYAEGM